ncbi:MAG: DNA repair protein RecO [Mogibacterium sp.]|nr:DNA repair protein RecO [Mogibacterium sp.]MBQ6389230.1 DNA repair protein RecO [Mogibacterium sp.]
MLITSEGLVLRQRKIANNRRMIVIFTRQYGKISAGTSLTEKSRSRAALALRPFTFSEYELFKGREAYSINSASVKKSYFSVGEDLDRFMVASAFINFLDRVLQEEEPMPGLFDLSLEFMDSVARASAGTVRTLLYAFVVKSFSMLGVMPEITCCVNCGRELESFGHDAQGNAPGKLKLFSVSSGGVICEDCANREKSDGDALIYRPTFDIIDTLRFFMTRPLSTFEKVNLKKETADSFGQIIAEYTSRYLGADILSELL